MFGSPSRRDQGAKRHSANRKGAAFYKIHEVSSLGEYDAREGQHCQER
jgi:hypothetical protein